MSQSAMAAPAARKRRVAKSKSDAVGRLRVTLRRSLIGHPKDQKDTAKALGLTKMNRSITRPDTPAIRGMVTKIIHLVRVEQVGAGAKAE